MPVLRHFRYLPEEGGLHNASGLGVPMELMGHGQDGNAHVHTVHVTEHERQEAQSHDCPPSFPLGGRCNHLNHKGVRTSVTLLPSILARTFRSLEKQLKSKSEWQRSLIGFCFQCLANAVRPCLQCEETSMCRPQVVCLGICSDSLWPGQDYLLYSLLRMSSINAGSLQATSHDH